MPNNAYLAPGQGIVFLFLTASPSIFLPSRLAANLKPVLWGGGGGALHCQPSYTCREWWGACASKVFTFHPLWQGCAIAVITTTTPRPQLDPSHGPWDRLYRCLRNTREKYTVLYRKYYISVCRKISLRWEQNEILLRQKWKQPPVLKHTSRKLN